MTIMVRDSHSLKEKRRIIKSLKERTRQRFNLSVAEIGGEDSWQRCELGITLAGNDSRYVNSVLSKTVNFVQHYNQIELIDYQIEVI